MIRYLVNTYEMWIVRTFGYKSAVIVEEILYGAGMLFLGMILMGFISAFFILRLHSLKDFGESQVKILRVDNGKESTQIISIRNIKEAFEQLMLLSFSPFFTIKRFTGRDARRTRWFLRITFAVVIIVILFAVISTLTVLGPI